MNVTSEFLVFLFLFLKQRYIYIYITKINVIIYLLCRAIITSFTPLRTWVEHWVHTCTQQRSKSLQNPTLFCFEVRQCSLCWCSCVLKYPVWQAWKVHETHVSLWRTWESRKVVWLIRQGTFCYSLLFFCPLTVHWTSVHSVHCPVSFIVDVAIYLYCNAAPYCI